MKFKYYYDVLGVACTESGDEIKKAYKKLAHQYHPGISIGSEGEAKFQDIGEVMATIKGKEKYPAYDDCGLDSVGEELRPPPNWAGNQSSRCAQGYSFDNIDLANLFARFSKGNSHLQPQDQPIIGQDYELAMQITLDDVYRRTTLDLSLVNAVIYSFIQTLISKRIGIVKLNSYEGLAKETNHDLPNNNGAFAAWTFQ